MAHKPKMMKVSKEQIIHALKTEKLAPGNWIVKDKEGCRVCAVGAVLRSCRVPDRTINHFASDELWLYGVYGKNRKEIRNLVKRGEYLQALSDVFETDYSRERDRKRAAIDFVEKYFPAYIEIPKPKKLAPPRD